MVKKCTLLIIKNIGVEVPVLRDALSRWESREEPGTIWEREYAQYTVYDESWKQALEEG